MFTRYLVSVSLIIFCTGCSITNRCAAVPALAVRVSEIRKLPLKQQIQCIELSKSEYIEHKEKDYVSDENPDRLAAEELTYKQIGLIPDSYDYQGCLAESYTQDLLASYDTNLKAILLPAGSKIDQSIIAHEIVHALQDQHFSLNRLQREANQSSDSALALAALVEGDALLLQESFPISRKVSDQTSDLLSVSSCAPPAGLELQFDFPYGYGLIYAKRLSAKSGSLALDQGLSSPPSCTAAIIHKNFPPSECPEWKKIGLTTTEQAWISSQIGNSPTERFTESLGEFTLGLLFTPQLGRQKSILAAKGWTGDRLVLWQGQSGHMTSLITTWDTANNAQEFIKYFSMLNYKTKPRIFVQNKRVSIIFGPK